MCGRFSLFPYEDISLRFDLGSKVEVEPRYNISPSQDSLVIMNIDGKREHDSMKWGMVFGERTLINVRCETLSNKPRFMELADQNRCIIPMSSFYEWRTTKVGKIPYMFYLEGLKTFSVAGLQRMNPMGTGHEFTILTTKSMGEVARIHNRMPLLLSVDDEGRWLEGEDWKSLLEPSSHISIRKHQVSPEVNNPANEGSRLIEPISRIENWA